MDLSAVWAFRVLLGRDFKTVGEYKDAVEALPRLVLGARKVLGSVEFGASVLTDPCCLFLR